MFTLNRVYRPITAQPFLNNETHIEIQPCEALKPYICCFWGTQKPCSDFYSTKRKDMLIIPDTCMDIIFNLNTDANQFNGLFAGISDTAFLSETKAAEYSESCFAIRFYSWAVPLFSDESMKYALNSFVEVETYFKNFQNDLYDILIDNSLIHDRVDKVQQYLLKRIDTNKQNNNVLNAVYNILKSKGTINISELARFTAISQRQLERLFMEYVGVSPKKFSGFIRYQYLWQDILFDNNFNIQNAVCKYGYSDQQHLLKDFRRYHTMCPIAARKFALDAR